MNALLDSYEYAKSSELLMEICLVFGLNLVI